MKKKDTERTEQLLENGRTYSDFTKAEKAMIDNYFFKQMQNHENISLAISAGIGVVAGIVLYIIIWTILK